MCYTDLNYAWAYSSLQGAVVYCSNEQIDHIPKHNWGWVSLLIEAKIRVKEDQNHSTFTKAYNWNIKNQEFNSGPGFFWLCIDYTLVLKNRYFELVVKLIAFDEKKIKFLKFFTFCQHSIPSSTFHSLFSRVWKKKTLFNISFSFFFSTWEGLSDSTM